ncbi:TonB-dependent receptor [Sphingomonas koreensis]|nr:TonB-dependent receptor [Sphingomonas koreensis]
MKQGLIAPRTVCAVLALSVGVFAAFPAMAASVRGRVVDAAKGTPLPGATVTASGASATAGPDGEFSLDNLPNGPVTVTVNYIGYDATTIDLASDAAEPAVIALTSDVAAGDIVVTGNRLAERRALQTKKSADNVVEALYANDVGKLPDQNVAEAVKRLPGISVANDQGEGRYVIIRGVDPNLVNVTLNGQTLPAPEPDGRQVKLDDLPSSLIQSVVIQKSLTPDLDANAIGGSVDIDTVTAFDRNKHFFFDARGAYGWYKLNHKSPWEADGQVGGLFGPDKQFGAVVSVNYSRRPIESENFQGSEAYNPINGFVVPDYAGLRDYHLVRTRLGVVGNFDWRPSDAAQLYLRTSYSKFTDNEYRDQNIIEIGDPEDFSNQTATSGTFEGATSIKMRRRRENDNTRSATLGGEFDVGPGHLSASGGYTRAIKLDPVRSEFTFNGPDSTVDYDLTTDPYTFVARGNVFDDPSDFKFNKVNFDHRRAVEKLWQARADYALPLAIGDGSTLKIGAKYLTRNKSDDEESLAYKKGGTAFTLSDFAYVDDTGFYDGMYHFGDRVDWDAASAYVNANPDVVSLDEGGSIADSLSADYDVRESITAGYAMLTIKTGGLTLVPGVRFEHTEDKTKAKIIDDASTFGDGFNSFGKKSYTDWFPGLNAKYEVGQSLVLRGAVTTSIGRPNYPDLAPYILVEDETENVKSISLGNPDLKPLKAINADAAVEYYLPSQGIISVGLFYKHIDNPIYTTQALIAGGTYAGVTYDEADVSQPINADSEELKGIEVNGQVQFTFLPAPFDGFGLSANYTYVEGHATAPDFRPGKLPLFFQSHDVSTLQLFYEKYGFAARVAYSFRSAYLDVLGSDPSTDEYTDDNGQLDVHASYQLTPNFTVFADGTNLTDAPWRRYIGTPGQLVERERYSFMLRGGVQVHF